METGKDIEKFIYVFSIEDRDKLISRGFALLKEDPINNLYVFVSNPNLLFDDEIRVFYSNILTF